MPRTYHPSGTLYRPESITKPQFEIALSCYQSALESIATDKNDLLALDEKRYHTLPKKYKDLATKTGEIVPLEHADVVTLVEWKLKHGTFRPGLLQKAHTNSPSSVKTTTTSAFQDYSDSQDASSAIKTLSTLPGIGPATASLLLSIHSPSHTPFFSDECFLWLCRSGTKSTIKYNAKEYGELLEAATEVMERLGVQAVDVEKVAFALMRYNCSEAIVAAEKDTTSTMKQEGQGGSEAAPLKHSAEDLQSGAARMSRQESTEDQKPEKTRIGEVAEVRADDANRLKRAASNAGTGTPRKRKLEAAETTGAEGNINSAALEVLKK